MGNIVHRRPGIDIIIKQDGEIILAAGGNCPDKIIVEFCGKQVLPQHTDQTPGIVIYFRVTFFLGTVQIKRKDSQVPDRPGFIISKILQAKICLVIDPGFIHVFDPGRYITGRDVGILAPGS